MKETIKTIPELRDFAARFLANQPRGTAIGLSGELGAGKTEFVRQVISLICETSHKSPAKVVSPSFVIHQSYPSLNPPIEHFDLYRLENVTSSGLIDIGYYDALDSVKEGGGLLFVEWPAKVRDLKDLQLAVEISFLLEKEVRVVQVDVR